MHRSALGDGVEAGACTKAPREREAGREGTPSAIAPQEAGGGTAACPGDLKAPGVPGTHPGGDRGGCRFRGAGREPGACQRRRSRQAGRARTGTQPPGMSPRRNEASHGGPAMASVTPSSSGNGYGRSPCRSPPGRGWSLGASAESRGCHSQAGRIGGNPATPARTRCGSVRSRRRAIFPTVEKPREQC